MMRLCLISVPILVTTTPSHSTSPPPHPLFPSLILPNFNNNKTCKKMKSDKELGLQSRGEKLYGVLAWNLRLWLIFIFKSSIVHTNQQLLPWK